MLHFFSFLVFTLRGPLQLDAATQAKVSQANTLRKQAGKSDSKPEQKKLYHQALELYQSVVQAFKSPEEPHTPLP